MRSSRRQLLGGLSVTIALGLAGCFGLDNDETVSPDALEEEYDAIVETTDKDNFVPETITISVGESVVWYNNGDRSHTITAYDDNIPEEAEYFASGEYESEAQARDHTNSDSLISNGETYSNTFTVAGTYEYFCIPHEHNMTGTVIVEE